MYLNCPGYMEVKWDSVFLVAEWTRRAWTLTSSCLGGTQTDAGLQEWRKLGWRCPVKTDGQWGAISSIVYRNTIFHFFSSMSIKCHVSCRVWDFKGVSYPLRGAGKFGGRGVEGESCQRAVMSRNHRQCVLKQPSGWYRRWETVKPQQ